MNRELLWMRGVSLEKEDSSIRDFHMIIHEGEIVELLGATGSGKTALAAFFRGEIPLLEGMVRFQGKEYRKGEFFSSNGGCLVVEKRSGMIDSLTVAENICLLNRNLRRRGILVHRRRMEERTNYLLSLADCPVNASAAAWELTDGEKKICELLRALQSEVPMIFLDDAFSGFGQSDMRSTASVLQLLSGRGITILSAGAGKPDFPAIDSRVIVLRRGRCVRNFFQDNFDMQQFQAWMSGNEPLVRLRAPGHAGEKTVLNVENLSAGRYLRKCSFSVREGEIIGFYDMNHRSNRELAQVLTGQLQPEEGDVRLHGQKIQIRSAEDAYRTGIGYLPDDYADCSVAENLSVRENLMLPVMKKTSRAGLVSRNVQRYLGKNWPGEGRMRAGELDRIGRLKIALEKWTMVHPAVLVVEAPLNEMDTELYGACAMSFQKLAGGGTAVLLVSQNLAALRQMADRFVVMNS